MIFGKRRKALEREIAGLQRVLTKQRSDNAAQTRRIMGMLDQLREAGITEKEHITEALQPWGD